MTKLIDNMGIALEDVHKWLPARAADFRYKKITDKKAAGRWRQNWIGRHCWWCKSPTSEDRLAKNHGEVHHMVRMDAAWAFAWICASCHRHLETAVTRDAFPELIRLKHYYDRPNTLWIPLAIAKGRFLE